MPKLFMEAGFLERKVENVLYGAAPSEKELTVKVKGLIRLFRQAARS